MEILALDVYEERQDIIEDQELPDELVAEGITPEIKKMIGKDVFATVPRLHDKKAKGRWCTDAQETRQKCEPSE